MKKALIAMSGGVDSSVAAAVMKDRGYDCVGVTMKLYTNSEIGIKDTNSCCSADDIADARSVAFSLGIPHYVFNFKDVFGDRVINNFVNEYISGRTPNPCIECNRKIKFEAMLDRAKTLHQQKSQLYILLLQYRETPVISYNCAYNGIPHAKGLLPRRSLLFRLLDGLVPYVLKHQAWY